MVELKGFFFLFIFNYFPIDCYFITVHNANNIYKCIFNSLVYAGNLCDREKVCPDFVLLSASLS